MATPARTVTKGSGKSFKNTLDLPFKLKWPVISNETATLILNELVRSLDGLKFTAAKKKKRKTAISAVASDIYGTEGTEHVPKRQCLDKEEHASVPTSVEQKLAPSATDSTEAVKRSQIVVGVNQVTKSLERGLLRAVVVCLSVKPALLHEHIQILSSTRGVPSVAVHGMSDTVAPVLGLKSAMAIGLKKISTTTSVDYFSALAELIANRAPKIHIPWLQATVTGTKYGKLETAALVNESKTDVDIFVASGKLEGSQPSTSTGTEGKEMKVDLPTQIPDNEISQQARYLPVAIKRTIIIPKQGK